MNITAPYKKHMVVWMDIQGFKNKVRSSQHDQKEIQSLLDTLRLAKTLAERFSRRNSVATFDVGVFSDSIMMSCINPDISALYGAIGMVSFFQAVMAGQRCFLRGAVLVGPHHSEEGIYFGPTMVDAQEIEKCADWFRVVIDPNLPNEIEPLDRKKSRQLQDNVDVPSSWGSNSDDWKQMNQKLKNEIDMFTRLDKGVLYVDYLRCAFNMLTPMKWARQLSNSLRTQIPRVDDIDLLPTHKESIEEAVKDDDVRDDSKLLTRYNALAVYHNDALKKFFSVLPTESDTIETTASPDFKFMYGYLSTIFTKGGIHMSEAEKKNYWNGKIIELTQLKANLRDYEIELTSIFPQQSAKSS